MSFFKNSSIGVVIGDHFIEVADVVPKNIFSVQNSVNIPLNDGIVRNGVIKNAEALREEFQKALNSAKPKSISPKKIICAIPDSYVYVYNISAPKGSEKKYQETISDFLKDSVPIDWDDVFFSYTVSEDKNNQKVNLVVVATSREIISSWDKFFASLGIDVVFGVSSLAVFGVSSIPKKSKVVCFVDARNSAVNLSVFEKKTVYYNHRKNISGDSFLDDLSNEIVSIIEYLKNTYNKKIDTIIFSSTDNTDIKSHLENNIGVPTVRAKIRIELNKKNNVLSAAGLATCLLDKRICSMYPLVSLKTAHLLPQPKEENEIIDKDVEDIEDIRIKNRRLKKLKKQKIALLVLLLIGLIVIGGVYWLRLGERQEKQAEIQNTTTQFTQTQSIDISVEVAIDKDDYNFERISGRISDHVIKGSGSYGEALANAKRLAEKDLVEGEVLWETSINEPDDKQKVTFPLEIEWLVYSEEEMEEVLIKKLDELNVQRHPYSLNIIKVNDISRSDDNSIFDLKATISLSINELIDIPSSNATSSDAEDTETTTDAVNSTTTLTIIILETPTGWLNVRSGPGTNYEQVERVNPSETYSVLEETDDWYKIEISDEKEGWVFREFAELEE